MPQEIVRVLRVIIYTGPREWVENTVAGSIQGTKYFGKHKFIHCATVGAYPEILSTSEALIDFTRVSESL